ncbi:MAG TPA: hypothetical protein VMH81_34060 [Bryobacteraceae bacterium]|nr:hypothetical protein [Bryobacteraceae bacterium]
MPILLEIAENPNCEALAGQVFQCRSAARVVTHVHCEHDGAAGWSLLTGIHEGGAPCAATACIVEDSGEGACFLVVGGEWGLRLKPTDSADEWDLANRAQWGVPYLLLGGDGADLRFADE